ncbi:IS110 family transposase [Brachybacterium phenoliresistens]|uniref:Transposase n=1 Tax=Brachybacterium phenoliresistens TaxID=396014 RepID=Z9JWG6_9MICO|nr:IS110 family transposase [Brachybacterium phenoliresistens]EWS82112.1 transposase [Brachybacterium phenoliresistens]
MDPRFTVVIGLDVGKTGHHACALDPDGERLFDKPLPQDEAELREVFTGLQKHGEVLMVVDQPNTIGALPIAVAKDCGCAVAYLPGLAMRKAADLYPGRSKTDARDAFIIADTARTMPHTLRAVDRDNEVLSALKVLAGFDEDLAQETTRALNRIRSLLTQIHPALERVFTGGTLSTGIVLDLLEKFAGPTGLRTAGRGRVLRFARAHARRDPEALIDQVFAALDEQTVVVPATAAVELVIPRVAGQVKELKEQRATVAREVEAMLEDFPLAGVLMSMPGIGIKTAAQILLAIGDASTFESAGHLAAYAGIAPVTRRSGTSIRGEFPARSGNKRLKNALFYSSWVASHSDPVSKAYYDRKRAEGKRHNAAVICLARRRCNVIFAMLRNGTYYQPPINVPSPDPAALAA